MELLWRARRRLVDYARAYRGDPVLVSDGANWILDEIAERIAQGLDRTWRPAVVARVPPLLSGRSVHFINRYAALEGDAAARAAGQNRLIISWFHGDVGLESQPALRRLAERFAAVIDLFDIVHVSASGYRSVVERLGASPQRIVMVPIGVDTNDFAPADVAKDQAKRALGIPADALTIGSFQRDGDAAPKLVKGPDLLVRSLIRIKERIPGLVVLLTGPGRGWIRRELDANAVPYRYFGLVPDAGRQRYFHACDLYVISSREEGGPAALLEAMACEVPVVATRTGMCPDVISDGHDGALFTVGDTDAMADTAIRLLTDGELRSTWGRNARMAVRQYDWRELVPRYALLYRSAA